MSISLTNFLADVNNLLDDSISGTTTSDGNAGKTTFIDSGLNKYEDNYFGDPERKPEWWAYLASELRPVKASQSSSGTVEAYNAFTAQVTSLTAYELHRFDRDKKIIACNQALDAAYPWFYARLEDSTTLDGLGASDNEYEVPATFTDFPNQIWKKNTESSVITYTPITNFTVMELSGAWKFYANITLDDDIVLVGKNYLTQFTNDASTTELTSAQAAVVAMLACSIFYRTLSGVVNANDSGRFDSLANRFEQMYEAKKFRHAMPLLASRTLDFGWLS